MTKAQLSKAVRLAKSDVTITEDIDIFHGFGRNDFEPVYVTIEQVARLIRWQCGCMDGTWDSYNLQEIARYGRARFHVL